MAGSVMPLGEGTGPVVTPLTEQSHWRTARRVLDGELQPFTAQPTSHFVQTAEPPGRIC